MFRITFLIIFSILLLLFISPSSHALYLGLDFSLDNQTYNWHDSISVAYDLSNQTNIKLNNRSTATLIKESVFGDGGDRWQKLSRSSVRLEHKVTNNFISGLEVFQDFNRLEDRLFIGNTIYLFADYFWKKVTIKQNGGVVWEKREQSENENTQTGFGYQATISGSPSQNNSYGNFLLEGKLLEEAKTPQKNISLGYNIKRSFSDKDSSWFDASIGVGEKKYFPLSGNYQSIARQKTQQRKFDFQSNHHLPLQIYLKATVNYRYSRYQYDYDEFEPDYIRQSNNLTSLLEYNFSLQRYIGKKFLLKSSYLFNRTNEDYGSQQTNQKAETGQFDVSLMFSFDQTDTVEVSGKVGVTSYFAPSTSQFFSDRDRTLKVLSGKINHQFTPYLSGAIYSQYRGFHTIFISGELSANNSVNNVYILNPSLIWKPFEGITLQQDYQLHANYLYYDFEKLKISGRNTIYRRANMINKLILTPSPNTDFIIEYSYKYEDFGPLQWADQWQQQISWDRRTHRPRFGVDYHPNRWFKFHPYWSIQIQKSYDHLFDEEKTLGQRERSEKFVRKSIGFDLLVTLSSNSYIEANLQRRVLDYLHQRDQEYDLFTIAIKRYL